MMGVVLPSQYSLVDGMCRSCRRTMPGPPQSLGRHTLLRRQSIPADVLRVGPDAPSKVRLRGRCRAEGKMQVVMEINDI